MKLLDYEDADFRSKTIFIRLDLNVPISSNEVSDDFKIKKSLPCIYECLAKHPKTVILGSHLGRPKGQHTRSMSLISVYKRLCKLMGNQYKIRFSRIEDLIGLSRESLAEFKIILLENLRFYKEEETYLGDDNLYTKFFNKFVDEVVVDAFGVLHRYCGSIGGLRKTKLIYTGPLVHKEIQAYSKLKHRGVDLLILGGCKISDKIGVIETLITTCKVIYIAGGLSYTFLKHHMNKGIGQSLFDESSCEAVDRIYALANQHGVKIHLPVDFVVKEGETVFISESIPEDGEALDIGPKSVAEIGVIVGNHRSIFWNGPVGKIEEPAFSDGTKSLVKMLENCVDSMVVVGGGETAKAVKCFGEPEKFYHVSTGGGAFMKLLGNSDMPGLKDLSYD